MPLTTHLPLSFPLQLPMATCTYCIPLPTFSAPELNYDVHDKELLAIFELSNDGDITSKALDF